MSKPFKNLNEQLSILSSRDLKFSDYTKHKRYLLSNNYYNVINGYSKFFMDKQTNQYYSNATFDEIARLYYFDKEIKAIVFKNIIDAEEHLKSIIAYQFAKFFKDSNHSYSYLQASNYEQRQLLEVIKTTYMFTKLIQKHIHQEMERFMQQ